MEGSLAVVLGLSGGDDHPQLTLMSLVLALDSCSIVGTVVDHTDILVLLDALDSVEVALLFKDEPLVGGSVEAVHDEVVVVILALGDVEGLDAVAMDCVEDVVLVGLELGVLCESHALVVADVHWVEDMANIQQLGAPV